MRRAPPGPGCPSRRASTSWGGNAIYLSDKDSQIGRNEPVQDTARVLSRFCDGIMIRTFAQEEVETLAKYATIPVISGLTDFCHPCQVLADLMTIREHKGKLEGLKLCYIGDGNNMANSLIVGGLKCGMQVSIACPADYQPDPEVLAFARDYPGMFQCTPDILAAAKDADVLYTDVWASMGQEGGVRPAEAGVRGVPDQRRRHGRRTPQGHGAALPPPPTGGGDHRRGL